MPYSFITLCSRSLLSRVSRCYVKVERWKENKIYSKGNDRSDGDICNIQLFGGYEGRMGQLECSIVNLIIFLM